MKTYKLKLIVLSAILLATQCHANGFSKVTHITSAIYTAYGVNINLTRDISEICVGKRICKVNIEEILISKGYVFAAPYDFIIDYDTTKNRNKHKEMLNISKPSVTVKGYFSHRGTVLRGMGKGIIKVLGFVVAL